MTDDTKFYGLEVSLNNILMLRLFVQTTGWQFFLKQKKIISQQTHNGPYIYDINIEVEWGGLKICQVFADFFVFKQKIYCSFLQMERGG